MALIGELKHYLLGFAVIVLAVALLLSLLRAVLGPRFSDRIMAIKMISAQAILIICILAILIGQHYLADVALAFSIVSFLIVLAATNMYLSMLHERAMQQRQEQETFEQEAAVKETTSDSEADTEETPESTSPSEDPDAYFFDQEDEEPELEIGKRIRTDSDEAEEVKANSKAEAEEEAKVEPEAKAREEKESDSDEDQEADFFDAEDGLSDEEELQPGDSLLHRRGKE